VNKNNSFRNSAEVNFATPLRKSYPHNTIQKPALLFAGRLYPETYS